MPKRILCTTEHCGNFRQAAAMKLEIFVIGPGIAPRLDRGRGPRAAQLGRYFGQGRQSLQVGLVVGRVVVPAHGQPKAADLEPRTGDQPQGLVQSLRAGLLGQRDDIEIQSLEAVRQHQLDELAVAGGYAQCLGIQILEHRSPFAVVL